MLTPKEQATDLLNRSLKMCIHLSHDLRFNEAKELALLQVMSIKEAIYNVSLIDNHICKKSLLFYTNVKNELESLTLKNDYND
tara:strand:- start:580 stop:828 length:249 start_codon:yes stop_codon:yes gene_type:complete